MFYGDLSNDHAFVIEARKTICHQHHTFLNNIVNYFFIHIFGMKLRRVEPASIVDSAITLWNAGIKIPADDLETHVLSGGQLRATVDAVIAANKAALDGLKHDPGARVERPTRELGFAARLIELELVDNEITDHSGRLAAGAVHAHLDDTISGIRCHNPECCTGNEYIRVGGTQLDMVLPQVGISRWDLEAHHVVGRVRPIDESAIRIGQSPEIAPV